MNDGPTGREILLLTGGVVVVFSGVVGFFIGSNSAESSPTFEVLGTVALPTSPASLALYGMVVSALAMALFVGLVSFASRFDEA